jgi:hypothetical protein
MSLDAVDFIRPLPASCPARRLRQDPAPNSTIGHRELLARGALSIRHQRFGGSGPSYGSREKRSYFEIADILASTVAVGRVKWSVTPWPPVPVAQMRPPCDSTMDLLIASPMPLPCGFVVKNASKT